MHGMHAANQRFPNTPSVSGLQIDRWIYTQVRVHTAKICVPQQQRQRALRQPNAVSGLSRYVYAQKPPDIRTYPGHNSVHWYRRWRM
mmetsp:Transcript_27547/g.68683  ORF Transcript_27547/g.68683 Transcript_27547/m.68683 type:complete len:87 (-) Transcript_27547:366-626(-)